MYPNLRILIILDNQGKIVVLNLCKISTESIKLSINRNSILKENILLSKLYPRMVSQAYN